MHGEKRSDFPKLIFLTERPRLPGNAAHVICTDGAAAAPARGASAAP